MIRGWRAPREDERQLAWVAFTVAVAAVVLSPVAGLVSRFLPPCLFRQWTGLPCPTCGSSRAILSLVRGDPAGALSVNPLAAVAVVTLLVAGVTGPWWLLAKGKVPMLDPSARRVLLWSLFAVAMANWVYLAVSEV